MRAVNPSYNNNEEIRYENKIKNNKNDIFRMIINDDYGNHKYKMMMMMIKIIVMMMEILQCHLKINEYTCKNKFYVMYEMSNMNMINEISP